MATNTYVALDKATVSGSSTTTITFNSIPSTYTDLVIVADFATSAAGAQTVFYFNGVTTGTPYSSTELYGTGSAASSYRFSNQNHIWLSGAVGSGATLGQTNMTINVQNYANATTHKTALTRQNSNSGTYPGTLANVGLWRSTSAITSVSIKADIYSTTFVAGSTFSLYGIAAEGVSPAAKATGGAIYSDSTYYYHVFGSTGTFTPLSSLSADVLVVAGGGGGNDGGGGAGGIAYFASSSLTATGYTATVGAGGAGSSSVAGGNGVNSSFGALTAASGGGGGAHYNTGNGIAGGSGGGAPRSSSTSTTGGASNQSSSGTTAIYGNAGGAYVFGGTNGGGGGGGAGGVGNTNNAVSTGGLGTNAFLSWMTATGLGVSGFIAGGGGAYANPTQGLGSAGGGNGSTNSLPATPGQVNTGSGGGGAAGGGSSIGTGGSGVVIVRYTKV